MKRIIKKLSKRRKRSILEIKISDGLRDLKKENLDAAKESLEWIDTYNKLKEAGYNKRKIRWAILIGIACILILNLLITIPISKASLSAQLTTSSVQFKLEEPYKFKEKFMARSIRIDNINFCKVGVFDRVIIDSTHVESQIRIVGQTQIKDFRLENGSVLDIEPRPNGLMLFLKNGMLKATFHIRKGKLIYGNQELEFDPPSGSPPEEITIRTQVSEVIPSRIVMDSISDWYIQKIKVSNLRFLQEDLKVKDSFPSSIIKGQVKVLQTGKVSTISAPEFLILDTITQQELNIGRLGDSLSIDFQGDVESGKYGNKNFLKELKPNMLKYLYYNNEVALLWGAIVFIWGMIWSIKNSF